VPILQRAKRVVVTGDPKQLRHVSFLSRERQRNISERVAGSDVLGEELDFRARSLLDLVLEHLETDRQLVFLDEHFRSRPELIAFSNEQFYDNNLKVMRTCPEQTQPGVRFERLAGTRGARGVNREEAKAVCAAVTELIERERAATSPSSIGVLSPFRDQVEFLERKLAKELALADIQRHQLRVGTAYSFQGDERDCMFLSLAVDDASHGTAFSYLQRPDVFNVSITRARHRQAVFYSFDPRKLGANEMARRYIEQRMDSEKKPAVAEGQGMRSELIRALTAKGCECRSDLEVGGISIDLAVGLNGRWIGLDLISRAATDPVLSVEQLRLLERAGFRVFPVGQREWTVDPAACVEQLGKLFK
jgi:superfamily I DNA and/or RNA helicase